MENTAETIIVKNESAMFTQRVNALLESKYILADKKISSLLKGIVSSQVLMDVLRESLKTMTYAAEFARNRLIDSDANNGVRAKMTLPVDKKRLFTFVFCLLAEIDAGERDFSKFLTEYFGAENANESFGKFCDEIIVPFKKAGEHLLRETDTDGLDREAVQKGVSYFDAESIYVSSATSDAVIIVINKIKNKVEKDFQGGGEQYSECMQIIDAFVNALFSKNPKLINIVWIGFKNTLKCVKGFEREVARIKNILTEANLI